MKLYKKLLLAVTLLSQAPTFTWGEHTEGALDHASAIVHGRRYRQDGERYTRANGYQPDSSHRHFRD